MSKLRLELCCTPSRRVTSEKSESLLFPPPSSASLDFFGTTRFRAGVLGFGAKGDVMEMSTEAADGVAVVRRMVGIGPGT